MIAVACLLFLCGGIIASVCGIRAILCEEENAFCMLLIGVALVMTSFIIGYFTYMG